jgi:hypothetical protein
LYISHIFPFPACILSWLLRTYLTSNIQTPF